MASKKCTKNITRKDNYKTKTSSLIGEDKNIDDFFKSKLDNQKFDIPLSFIANLEQTLDAQTKKKRRFILFFTSGSVFVLLLLFAFLYNGNDIAGVVSDVAQSKQESVRASSKTKRNDIIQENITASDTVQNQIGNNRSDQVVENKIIENELNALQKNNNSKLGVSKVETDDLAIQGEVLDKNTDPVLSSKKESSINGKTQIQNGLNGAGAVVSSSHIANNDQTDDSKNTSFDKDKQPKGNIENKKVLTDDVIPNVEDNEISSKAVSIYSDPLTNDIAGQVDLEVLTPIEPRLISTIIEVDNPLDRTMEVESSPSVDEKIVYSLQIFGGVNQVNSIDKEKPTAFINQEEGFLSPQFGIDFIMTRNRFSLATGISTYSLGENLNHSFYNQRIRVETIFLESHYDYVYDQGEVIDSVFVIQYDNVIIRDSVLALEVFENRFRKIVIPLTFGYEFSLNETWSLTPRAGVHLELLIGKNRGTYQKDNYSTHGLLHKNVLLSYTMELELKKDFPKYYYFLSPTYHRSNNALQDNKWRQKSYISLGGKIGFGIKF